MRVVVHGTTDFHRIWIFVVRLFLWWWPESLLHCLKPCCGFVRFPHCNLVSNTALLPTFTGISLEEEGRTPGTCRMCEEEQHLDTHQRPQRRNHHVLWKSILPTLRDESMNALDNQSPPASPYSRIPGKKQHLKEPEESFATINRIWKNWKKDLQPATGSERTGEKHLKQQQDLNESLEERPATATGTRAASRKTCRRWCVKKMPKLS